MLCKKGEMATVVLIVIIIVIFFFAWIVHESWKECRNNKDCKKGQYCGSDFSCHDMTMVNRAPMDLKPAAYIIGAAFIVGMLIYKWDSIFRRNSPQNVQQPTQGRNGYVDLTKTGYIAEPKGLYEDVCDESED